MEVRGRNWRVGSVLLTGLLAGLSAQRSVAQDEPLDAKAIRKQTIRLIRLLELPHRRAHAASELVKLGKAAVPELARAVSDPRPEVVCQIAHLLRALGADARPALPALRIVANGEDERCAYAARWALAGFQTEGVILVADFTANTIVEFDLAGKKLLEIKGLTQPFDVERLPNGHYLVAECTGRACREVDKTGKTIWQFKKGREAIYAATRLPNGNTLVCTTTEVIEVDPKGKEVWKHASRPAYSARRLPNGNTLIAQFAKNRVVEIEKDGSIAWKYEQSKGPLDVHRLPNGNTLITCFNGKEVLEVHRSGKVVLRLQVDRSPDAACRLPDGQTLVGGNEFLYRYDARGKLVWKGEVKRAAAVKFY